MSEPVRTFIAVCIPSALRRDLEEFTNRLRRSRADVKWVRLENMHLTLKFLGNVAADRLQPVFRAVERAVSGRRSFDIQFGGCGTFPGGGHPRVLWVGLRQGAESLRDLAAAVDESLAAEGFERERRPFSAHLTLGRVRSQQGIKACVEAMQTGIELEPFRVKEVTIFRSDLHPSGPKYTPLHSIQLEG